VIKVGRSEVLSMNGTALGLKAVVTGEGEGRPSPRPSYSFLLASSLSLLKPPMLAELGGVEFVGDPLELVSSFREVLSLSSAE